MIDELNSMTMQSDNVTVGLGVLFKTKRESAKLSLKDVAARLRLGVHIIELIENDKLSDNIPATFMRGYIRSYAKLLDIKENELAPLLKPLDLPKQTIAPPTVLNKRIIQRENRHIRWMTYAIVLTLMALVSIWWASHSNGSDIPEKASVITAAPAPNISPLSATAPQVADKPVVANANLVPQSTTPLANAPAVQPIVAPPPAIAQPAAPKESKPAVQAQNNQQSISKMVMALPEPGLDNSEDNSNDS